MFLRSIILVGGVVDNSPKAGKKKKAVVAKVFTSKSGNTFLNIGAPMLSDIEGKKVKITGPNRAVQGRAGNSDQRCFLA